MEMKCKAVVPTKTEAQSRFCDDVTAVCQELSAMLIDKNRKYGDSALNPVRVFSKAGAMEQIRVQLDDKLSRLNSGQADDTEDVEWDLMGYLVLLRVAARRSPVTVKEPMK